MKRWQRQVWTWSVGLLAGALIFLGILVGLFRIAVEVAPGYRQDLAQWVGDLLGSPVRIADLDLAWRGLYPTLILRDVVIEAEGGSLTSLHELQVGFALHRLVVADPVPARVVLIGPAVSIINDAGGMRLEGMRGGGQGVAARDLARRLLKIGEVVVRDATVIYSDQVRGLPQRRFDEIDLRARPLGVGFELVVSRVSIDDRSGRASGMAVFPTLEFPPQKLSLELEDWFPWEEARELIGSFPPVVARLDKLKLDAYWRGDSFVAAAGSIDLIGAGIVGSAPALETLRAVFRLERSGPGVHADISELELVSSRGAWPSTAVSLDVRSLPNEQWRIAFDAGFLRLDDLAAWMPLLREPHRELLETLAPRGDLRDVVGHWQSDRQIPALAAKLDRVGWNAAGGVPGLTGVSGVLSMDESRGRMQIDSRTLELELVDVFGQELPITHARAQLNWHKRSEGWLINAKDLDILALGLSASGELQFLAGERRQIDLVVDLRTDDPGPWKAYQPRKWSPQLRKWISRSIRGARVPRGQIQIQGDLADFPFDDGAGLFLVDLDVSDLNLKYSPAWPAIENGSARVQIKADMLDVSADSGRIHGVEIQSARAKMSLRPRSTLELNAQGRGDAGRMLAILADSPLRQRFHELIDSIKLSGPARLDMQLQLPLHELEKSEFKGRAAFDGVRLKARQWPEPVRDIRGQFDIAEGGLSGRKLTAKMERQSFEVDLSPADGVTRLVARSSMELARHGPDWNVPDWLSARGSGKSKMQVKMEFGGAQAAPIIVESDLVGTALDLPRPFGKAAEQSRSIRLVVEPLVSGAELKVKYADLLSSHMQFAPDGGDLTAMHLRLGAETAPRPSAPGLWIDGTAPFVSFGETYEFVRGIGGGGGQELRFGGMVVTVDGADAFGQQMSALRVQTTANADTWQMTLAGADAQGRVSWPRVQLTERGAVKGRFDRLHWGFSLDEDKDEEPIDPKLFPALDLVVKNFILNDQPLGSLDLKLRPMADGLQITDLVVGDASKPQFTLTGDWLRDARGSQGRFDFRMDTTRFPFWLAAFGYEESIRAARGRCSGHLQWPPTPGGLLVETVSGELSMAFNQGQILAVEPGAGRMLGLLSVNALPRRLFLDFRDVVDSGLGFDRINGKFQIVDGNAFTDKLTVNSPSLRIESRGRVGLAARDYDQTVTIFPSLSSGLTLAATVLGGPAVGLFTLFFQELLDKPIDQAGQLSYHLGGSWDNPVVSKPR